MAKQTNKQARHKAKPVVTKGNPVVQKRDFLDKLESHFAAYKLPYLILCLSTALIFGLLLFNVRITEGLDDAMYIEAGYRYAQNFFGYYFTGNPPLFVMILSIPIALFGVNLVAIKSCSLLFLLVSIFVFYRTFQNRVRYSILFPALLLTAINSNILFYASQAYTEMFVLMVMSLFCYGTLVLDDAVLGRPQKTTWKALLLFGFVAFLYYMSRALGYAAIIAAIAYFLLRKKWWVAAAAPASFGIFYLLYNKIIKPLCWGDVTGREISSTLTSYLQKDAYNAAVGYEDFHGIVVRFFTNLQTYSSQLFEMLQLKAAPPASPHSHVYSVVLIVLMLIGVIYAFKRKKNAVIFSFLMVGFLLGATFIVMHAFWMQGRLILIYLPLILITVFYGITHLLKIKHLRWAQGLYLIVVGILLLVNVGKTVGKVDENLPTLRKNLAGNMYYGWTPDWVNYFKMSKWAADSLPKEAVIACRKPSMSFIYARGRSFRGIMSVPSITLDSALQNYKYQHHFVGVEMNKMPQYIHNAVFPNLAAIVIGDNTLHYAYDISSPLYEQCVAELKRHNVAFYDSPDTMYVKFKQYKQSSAISPDGLLDGLKQDNVRYVLDASLRMNPAQKTENTITTVRRYLYFVEQKYPGTFRQIHQIGSNEGEPAMMYEVHYPK